MRQAFFLAFCFALITAINSNNIIQGQSNDSLLYLLDNDLVSDDTEKYNLLCKIISGTTDAEQRLKYCDQAIILAEKLNIMPERPYFSKGIDCLNSGNLALALECFIKVANYYKINGNNRGLARAYTYIAEVYNQQDNNDNERYYLQYVIDIYKEEKDSIRLAYALTNLGYANYSEGRYDTALVLFSETNDLFQKTGYLSEQAYCIGNSGLVYSKLGNIDLAEECLLQAIDTLTRRGDERAVTEYLIEYANVLQQKGEIRKAIGCAARGFTMAIRNGLKEYERDASNTLAKLYRISGRFDSAYYYQSIFINANDSIKSTKNIQKMADIRTEFEVAKKQSEVELLQKNKLFQRIVILGLIVILILAIGIILVYYLSLKRSGRLMAELDKRRILVEEQSSELKEKNDRIVRANEELQKLYEITNSQKEEIISSLNYAQRIQQAILPPEAYITELINENFVLYKPKEIVSGDFYWIRQINHYIILVVADCTGHGVPGALMSMLGISSLNEIVQRKQITQANQILNDLRREIKHSLRQTGKKEESRDGIDMALCVIDTDKNIVQYSGAYCPLYIARKNKGNAEIMEISADMMPVGVHFSSDASFTNHEIQLEIGDTLYISTDGFIDQVGGNNNTRFGKKNIKKLFLDIHDQPLYEQKTVLEKTLIDWMGDQPQRDDILVIGARVF